MNSTIKRALQRIGVGFILGTLSFVFIYLANVETLVGAWNGLMGGLLFVLSARQIALGISYFNLL